MKTFLAALALLLASEISPAQSVVGGHTIIGGTVVTIATPTSSVNSGAGLPQTVASCSGCLAFSDTTPAAVIHYNTTGPTAACTDTTYSSALSAASTTTYYWVACLNNSQSAQASGTLTISGGSFSFTATGKTCYASSGATAVNQETCTWSSPPDVGEFIACAASTSDSTSRTFSITDNATGGTNTYSADPNGTKGWATSGSPTAYNQTLYAAVARTNAGTMTSTVTISGSAIDSYTGLKCMSVSGGGTASIDGTAYSALAGASASGTCPCTMTATQITTVTDGDFIFVNNGTYNGLGSQDTGWSSVGATGTDPYAEYQVQATHGAITATAKNSVASDQMVMIVTAFKHQ